MNDTFWGLFSAQVDALKNAATPEESNTILLETAKLLVGSVDISKDTLSNYDKFAIRKLFASYGALGASVCSFYEEAQPQLDPAAQVGTIGKKIETVSAQIAAQESALRALTEQEKVLFAMEDELATKDAELKALKDKVERLKNSKINTAKEIESYKEQFQKIDATVQGYAEELAFWKAHLGEDSTIINQMKAYGVNSIRDLLSSIETLKTNIQQDLKALDILIGKVVKEEELARNAVLKKQNKIV